MGSRDIRSITRALAALLFASALLSGCILGEDPAAIEGLDQSTGLPDVVEDVTVDTPEDVQETETSQCGDSDPAACGAACTDCTALSHVGDATCVAGGCGISACSDGFANCNGEISDGCENPESDDACGPECTSCLDRPNSLGGACSASACVLDCNSGRIDCDGNLQNGCEAASGPTVCGVAGACLDCTSLSNVSSAQCTGQTCAISVCDWGWLDCDGDPADGCEQPYDDGICGATCGIDCTALAGVEVSHCGGSYCAIVACQPGRRDANGQWADGCEKVCALGECWTDSYYPFTTANFAANGIGYLGSSGGLVYRSEDDGSTWYPIPTPLTGKVIHVSNNGSNVVVAIDETGSVVRSTDKGLTWQLVLLPLGVGTPLAAAGDGDLFVMVGHGVFLRSTDAGAIWTDLSSSVNGALLETVLVEGQFILMAGPDSGSGNILRSDNAGDLITTPTKPANGTVRFLVADGARIYAGGTGFLAYTENEGLSWTPVADVPALDWTSISVSGDSIVLLSGSQFVFRRSVGTAADPVSIIEGDSLVGVHLIGSEALLYGSNAGFGRVMQTVDGTPQTYTKRGLTYARNELTWLYEQGDLLLSGGGPEEFLLRSADDGVTWNLADTTATTRNVKLHRPALSGDVGIIAGETEEILRTSDAGLSWQPGNIGLLDTYNDTAFEAGVEPTALVVGSNAISVSVIVLTIGTDGTMYSVPINCASGSMCNITGKTGEGTTVVLAGVEAMMGTNNGEVVRGDADTTGSWKSGGTWATVLLPLGTNHSIRELEYDGTNVLILTDGAGAGSLIYQSTDDGATWTDGLTPDTPVFNGTLETPIASLKAWDWDGSVGVAVGDAGAMYKSEDGGTTWTKIETGSTANLTMVQVDGQNVIAAAPNGIIVFSPDLGTTVGETLIDLRGNLVGGLSIDSGRALLVAPFGQVLTSVVTP